MEKKVIDSRVPHVLVLPYPARGHINPMLQFAKRLVSKGIKATLATTLFITNSVQSEDNSVAIESISDGYDTGGFTEAESVKAYLERFKTVGSKTLIDLIEKMDASGHPINCIVYDPFLPWALEVVKKLHLHGAAFFTQSCALLAIYYHVHKGKLNDPLAIMNVPIPGLPLLDVLDLPSFFSVPGSYPAYLEMVLNQFSNLETADWVLINTFDKLETEVVNWMEGIWPMKTIGPTLPSMFLDKLVKGENAYELNLWKPNDGTCMEWLDTRAIGSVVYVSFGSMASLGLEQMEEVAWGLKGSNSYFLWVVRDSEKEKVPSKFVEETREKGLLLNWSPQLEVLAHRAVGSFLTHCGWNSTLEGMSLGVPLVAVPQWTDQPTNAKYVEEVWGVGVRAKVNEKGIVSREEVELRIKEVMEGEKGEELKRNASKWRELAKEAVDEGGSSDKNIEEFVAAIRSKECA
ncbi:UDP-glycosyltransferase 74F2-like [Tasmannia lanceolata]|uniref:UDP-glycosyltransferase 74F2-like n=1 Tax=Tasmannia lanceolata TaxID=3420 RepID=UPI004062B1B0